MTEIVVHRSRHNTGLDIQPDIILVRFVCFRPNWVFDTNCEGVTVPLLFNIIGLNWLTGH